MNLTQRNKWLKVLQNYGWWAKTAASAWGALGLIDHGEFRMMIIMWTCLQTQLAKQFFVRGRKSPNCGVWVEIISSIGEELEVFGDTAAAGCCQVISWRCELSGRPCQPRFPYSTWLWFNKTSWCFLVMWMDIQWVYQIYRYHHISICRGL